MLVPFGWKGEFENFVDISRDSMFGIYPWPFMGSFLAQ